MSNWVVTIGYVAFGLWFLFGLIIYLIDRNKKGTTRKEYRDNIYKPKPEPEMVFPEFTDYWRKLLDEAIAELIIYNTKNSYMKYMDGDFLSKMSVLSKKHREEMNIKQFDENSFVCEENIETENLSEEEEEKKTIAEMMVTRFNRNNSGYIDYIEKMAEKYKKSVSYYVNHLDAEFKKWENGSEKNNESKS